MGLLTREVILQAGARVRVERVPVPEWGDAESFVYVRGMTAADRDRWDETLCERRTEIRALTLVLGVCDADGKPIFSADDVAFLMKADGPTERCVDAIKRLSGMNHQEEEALRKNFNGQGAGSQ